MEILQSILNFTLLLGIGAHQSAQKHPFNRRNVLALFVIGSSTVLSALHVSYNAHTFSEYTVGMAALSCMLVATTILTIIVWRMRPLFECLHLMNVAIGQRMEFPESREMYEKLDPRIERITQLIIFANMKLSYPFAMSSAFAFSFFMYFFVDAKSDAFLLVLPYWYPFDWKHPIGYLLAFTHQCVSMLFVNLLICIALGCGVGVYMWSMAFLNDVKIHFEWINGIAKPKKQQSLFSKKLFETVDAHSISMGILSYGSKTAQPIFLLLFVWATVAICSAMLIFNSEMVQYIVICSIDPSQSENIMVLVTPFFEMFWALALVFVSCELAGRMSYKFDEIDGIISQFNWYLFPLKVQRMLPIIISKAHEEIGFECFGSFLCNRETFKEVINCSYTNFMVLKNF